MPRLARSSATSGEHINKCGSSAWTPLDTFGAHGLLGTVPLMASRRPGGAGGGGGGVGVLGPVESPPLVAWGLWNETSACVDFANVSHFCYVGVFGNLGDCMVPTLKGATGEVLGKKHILRHKTFIFHCLALPRTGCGPCENHEMTVPPKMSYICCLKNVPFLATLDTP